MSDTLTADTAPVTRPEGAADGPRHGRTAASTRIGPKMNRATRYVAQRSLGTHLPGQCQCVFR